MIEGMKDDFWDTGEGEGFSKWGFPVFMFSLAFSFSFFFSVDDRFASFSPFLVIRFGSLAPFLFVLFVGSFFLFESPSIISF